MGDGVANSDYWAKRFGFEDGVEFAPGLFYQHKDNR